MTGHFDVKRQMTLKPKFSLSFQVQSDNIVRYEFELPENDNVDLNTVMLTFDSPTDEEIYGMGL